MIRTDSRRDPLQHRHRAVGLHGRYNRKPDVGRRRPGHSSGSWLCRLQSKRVINVTVAIEEYEIANNLVSRSIRSFSRK